MPLVFRTTRDFDRDIKRLKKRFRRIEEDLGDLVAEMRNNHIRGDFLPGYGLPIYKVRAANRSAGRGKRGGFRIVYYLQSRDFIIFLHIYSKSDQEDARKSEIWRRLGNID